jgi:hypothetical protein
MVSGRAAEALPWHRTGANNGELLRTTRAPKGALAYAANGSGRLRTTRQQVLNRESIRCVPITRPRTLIVLGCAAREVENEGEQRSWAALAADAEPLADIGPTVTSLDRVTHERLVRRGIDRRPSGSGTS